MHNQNNDLDVIVVGAGLGGLSTAAYLSAAGKNVLLLERYTALGGSSHVFQRRGRWEFDCGVHFVGGCGQGDVVSNIFGGLGLNDRIEWLPMDPAGFNRIIGPGFELATPFGWDAYRENLLAAFPGERRAVQRYHGTLRRIGEAMDRYTSQGSGSGLVRWMQGAGMAAPAMGIPYSAFLAGCGFSPRAIAALSVECGAFASTPDEVPAGAMAAYYQDYVGGGSYYPKGGGQMLAAGFADVVRTHGGQIRTSAGVERIIIENAQVQGVELESGEIIRAGTVVSDADAIKTFTELVGLQHLPRIMRERVKRWKMSRPLINGFFAVNQDISSQPNSNYFAIPSWDDATSMRSLLKLQREASKGKGFSDGVSWARDFADRQPMFVQSSSRRDLSNRRAAPDGGATIEVQTIVPYSPSLWDYADDEVESGSYRANTRYREIKKIVLDGMLQRLEQSFPGASDNVEFAELGSPATQERFVGNSGGAPFGLRQSVTQLGPLRAGVNTPISGLYAVGTNSAYGPGTVGSMLSGVHAASRITGQDLVEKIRTGGVLSPPSLLSPWPNDFDPLTATRSLR